MTIAKRKVHCVGIEGAGMSALARLFIERGDRVTGSDIKDGPRLEALRELGATIAIGHAPGHVDGADLVVASPAVPRDNAELKAARERSICVYSRTKALAELLNDRDVICVTGSHGKTTVTAMLTLILDRAGLRPGFMIGGKTASLKNRNARLGDASLFVTEACEAFRALDHWRPHHCIVTNLDDEHTEHYGDSERLFAAFDDLLARVPNDGVIALCGDDPGLSRLIARNAARVVTYGLGADTS
ncbi:MAG: Mur ligase domain-containing protein, partial [Terriglobia bacterium]